MPKHSSFYKNKTFHFIIKLWNYFMANFASSALIRKVDLLNLLLPKPTLSNEACLVPLDKWAQAGFNTLLLGTWNMFHTLFTYNLLGDPLDWKIPVKFKHNFLIGFWVDYAWLKEWYLKVSSRTYYLMKWSSASPWI